MKAFPDESVMPKSADGSEPIRGGSIALNRILGRFVEQSNKDHRPEFTAVLMSAYTVFSNVEAMDDKASIEDLEEAFVRDINLFLEYYDTYLSFTKASFGSQKLCPVVVYFPNYQRLESDLRREPSKRNAEVIEKYGKFLRRYNGKDGQVRSLEHVQCIWIRAGDATYPHKEVARKFREMTSHPQSLYASGDAIALVTHVPLDYHISGRLRNIKLLERYTGKIKSPDQFHLKLDKEGRIPFNTTTHVVFGDGMMIKPLVVPKVRRQLFEQAEKERWLSLSETQIKDRIVKSTSLTPSDLRKFDFV